MKFLFITTSFLFYTLCYSQTPKQSLPDTVYNEMIWFAKGEIVINDTVFKFDSNSSYYVVATITNELTNEIKEICTSSGKLEYAIKVDSNSCQKECNRKYSFSSKKSLDIIGFDDYDYKKFNLCTKEIDSDSLYIKAIKNPKYFANKYSGECQKYIAHLLFNSGVLSSSSSLSGHIYVLGKADLKELVKEILNTKQ